MLTIYCCTQDLIIRVGMIEKVLIYSVTTVSIIQSVFKFKVFFSPKIHMAAQRPRITKTILSRKSNTSDNTNLTSNYTTEHSNKGSMTLAQESHRDH